jgi:competence protein ComEC
VSRAAIFAMQVVTLAACLPPAPVSPVAPPPAPGAPAPGSEPAPPPTISWDRADELGDLTATPPPPGVWRVHLIDVGTGLAILVQGADFTLLYDAGSSDPGEPPARVLVYLAAALGPCGARLDHVILSHPHQDHASALDAVLHCYPADHVWDAGRVNDAVFYRDFLFAVADSGVAAYHTAAPPPADRTVRVKGIPVVVPAAVVWSTFSEGDEVALGAGAAFTVLHAEAKAHPDPNQNSIVVAVELGGARLLLTGDAESGERADPAAPLGDVEAHLVAQFPALIDADILQVGHHGSSTSSRRAFLAAVSPTLALVSAGPKNFKGVVLPDPEVVAALAATGATILRTDEHDAGCPWAPLGPAKGPGGCDSWIVTIE